MATLFASVGSPGTVSIASGGRAYAFNSVSVTPGQVLPANPSRQYFTVYNPGTIDCYIYPLTVVNTGSDVALTPSPSVLGGCIIVFANGGSVTLSGECQKAWGAFSASGASNPLTIMESAV